MEYLSFSNLGQWTLHKAEGREYHEPTSDYKPNSKQFKHYNRTAATGQLHEDFGTKGTLRGVNTAGVKKHPNIVNRAKVAYHKESNYNYENSGVGD